MNEHIRIRRLSDCRAMDHFLETLRSGGVVDENLVRAELLRGAINAVAPSDTDEARLMRFDEGGLLPAEPAEPVDGGWLQAVPNTIPEIAAILAERTRLLDSPVFWVHDPMLNETELAWKRIEWRKLGDQLYLVYDRDIKAERRIADAISDSMVSWHFLAFLTDGLFAASNASDLLVNASMIVVGAYDGESALIWERTS